MKNLLLLLIWAGFTTLLSAQPTTWFPPGAQWKYNFLGVGSYGEEVLEYAGTETVAGELCAKLHWYAYAVSPFGAGIVDYGYQYLFARDDSVFLEQLGDFKLLYDFTRQPGDTISSGLGIYDYAVVDATGDTTWQGIPVRYQDLRLTYLPDSGGGDTIIIPTRNYERLGGDHLLYWEDVDFPLSEIHYDLICYRDAEYPLADCNLAVDLNYHPFPTGWAVWSEENGVWCSFWGNQYLLQGDTTLPGIGPGKKLYARKTYEGSQPCPTPSTTILHEPFELLGVLRQDMAAKKVYFTPLFPQQYLYPVNIDFDFPGPIGQEIVLYDFDLEAGEVLDWKPEPNIFQYSDTIWLNDGSWRLRYFFMGNAGQVDTNYYWLESIGGSHGLFTSFVNPYTLDIYSQLQCFRENNQLKYNRIDAPFCDSVLVEAPEAPLAAGRIRLFPNPAAGPVILEIPNDMTPALLQVYDALGRLMGHQVLSQSQTLLSPFSWSNDASLLFLKIRGDNGRQAMQLLRLGK